ncbi:MAG: hypothetical protein Q4B79_05075 [Moraxella sp.]|uniref:hypothetical protein n=1 Tax=Moraxella sp. TaxID=479 RepID=UPI0026DD81BA|nr:hypothetical protein [Moraxella sp.]MDO4450315.1 hypothetical protein [Moraxella sp.]
MSFLKELFTGAGQGAGFVLGGAIKAVGHATDSNFIKEVGSGVENSMTYTGVVLGNVADGIADVVDGIACQDERKVGQGFSNLGNTAVDVGSQMVNTVATVAKESVNTVGCIVDGDLDGAKESVKHLGKVAVVSTLAIGIVDVVDSIEDTEMQTDNPQYLTIDNPNTHYVEPHERVLHDGRVIWVDGDGDTSVHRDTGWFQTNPDYKVPV